MFSFISVPWCLRESQFFQSSRWRGRHRSLPDDLDQNTFAAFPIEFSIKDLFPRTEVEPSASHGDHDLPTHDGPFQVCVGVVLTSVVPVLRIRLLRREFLEPDLEVLMKAGLVVIDEDTRRNVHGIDQAESLPDPAFAKRGFDLRSDVDQFPPFGDVKPEFFPKRFHGETVPQSAEKRNWKKRTWISDF